MILSAQILTSTSSVNDTYLGESAFPASPRAVVIGLGYVGLPLAKRLTDVGLAVVGIDINGFVVDKINNGVSTLRKYPDDAILEMCRAGFLATSDFSVVKEADAIIICVPTPLDGDGEPDLKAVIAAVESLTPHLREGQLVSLESTTWPGTTREVVAPIIARSGLELGKSIFLTFSPEREDPGNQTFGIENTPKLIGGMTENCLQKGVAFYQRFVRTVIPVSSPDVAEMAKVVENTYRYINISLVNELKIVASRLGMDIFEVLEAAGTKPFGFAKFASGPGIGGHCIPVDPHYLSWKARKSGLDIRFIRVAAEVDSEMPYYVRDIVSEALRRNGKCVSGASILALGVTYKRDTEDTRESPALKVLQLLAEAGATLSYSDPFVSELDLPVQGLTRLSRVDPTADVLRNSDAVVLLCDHSSFDYDSISEQSQLVIDTRGRFATKEHKFFRA